MMMFPSIYNNDLFDDLFDLPVWNDRDMKKAEKKYLKMRKKYLGDAKHPSTYEVRYITTQDFKFEPVDLSD